MRLISLKKWEFYCKNPAHTFKGILEGLNPNHCSPAYHLPISEKAKAAEDLLRAGLVPLPHFMRAGDRSISWYHGPFVPQPVQVRRAGSAADPIPAAVADQLLIWDKQRGMFDVSYAAAWELGRMLMLKNTRVALALFNWKRHHAHSLKTTRRAIAMGERLPVQCAPHGDDADYAKTVNDWLQDLTLLQHVPFNWLVPDERLLPPESLRFFSIDPLWMECLRDGAFSIGRTTPADPDRDEPVVPFGKAEDNSHLAPRAFEKAFQELSAAKMPANPVSGMLIRSEVVAGWPGLRVDAYKGNTETDSEKVNILRVERLSKNVLLCLFDNEVLSVDLYLPPETLHFGFDVSVNASENATATSDLTKRLRNKNGNEVDSNGKEIVNTPNAGPPLEVTDVPGFIDEKRVFDVRKLQRQMFEDLRGLPDAPATKSGSDHDSKNNELTPGIFALQMVAGVERVKFVRTRTPRSEGSPS